MAKRLCALALVIQFISVNSFAGPIIVGGGAGEGEFSVIFVHANLKAILAECLAISCQLTQPQSAVLADLMKTLDRVPTPIIKPLDRNRFEIHGSEVWINQNRLWQDAEQTQAFNLGDAGALWLEILGAQFSVETSAIGHTLQSRLNTESTRGEVSIGQDGSLDYGQLEFILWKSQNSDLLVVRDPKLNAFDLTTSIDESVNCDSPVGLRLFSPTWTKISQAQFTLQFGVAWECHGKAVSTNGFTDLNLRSSADGYVIDASAVSTFIEQ